MRRRVGDDLCDYYLLRIMNVMKLLNANNVFVEKVIIVNSVRQNVHNVQIRQLAILSFFDNILKIFLKKNEHLLRL